MFRYSSEGSPCRIIRGAGGCNLEAVPGAGRGPELYLCTPAHTRMESNQKYLGVKEKYLNRKSRPAHGGLLAEGEGSVEGGGVGAPVVAAVVGAGHLVFLAGVGAGVAVPPLSRPHLR